MAYLGRVARQRSAAAACAAFGWVEFEDEAESGRPFRVRRARWGGCMQQLLQRTLQRANAKHWYLLAQDRKLWKRIVDAGGFGLTSQAASPWNMDLRIHMPAAGSLPAARY